MKNYFTRQNLPKLVLLLVMVSLLVFTRYYNLSSTARYTNDEASDLAHIYQLGQSFKITLVGPISSDNSKVFGSLTYYLQLPFVMAFNYSAVSPAIGTAFWSVITALLMVHLTLKMNRSLRYWMWGLVLVWYPLVETGRWAWNPHFILLWIFAGLIAFLINKRWSMYLAGLLMGLSFHHHYVAIVALFGFFLTQTVALTHKTKGLIKDTFIKILLFAAGIGSALLPFVVFDLRHPPGLFFTRYLSSGSIPHVASSSADSFIVKFAQVLSGSAGYLVANSHFVWLFGVLVVMALVLDFRNNRKAIWWLLPVLVQLLGMSVLDQYASRYFLPAIPFFIYWLLIPRKNAFSQLLIKLVMAVMILSSLVQLPSLLTQTRVQPSPAAAEKIIQTIRVGMSQHPTVDINLAVLSSPDSAPLGDSYRLVLGMYGISLKQPSEYDTTSRLIVISTADETTLRQDKSAAMVYFKEVPLEKIDEIDQTGWKVYWFQK